MTNYKKYLFVALLSTLFMGEHGDASSAALANHKKAEHHVHTRAKIQSYYYDCKKKDSRIGCYPEAHSPCMTFRNCSYLVIWRFPSGSSSIAFELINPHLMDKKEKVKCDQSANANKTHYIAVGFSFNFPKKTSKIFIVECSIQQNGTGAPNKNVGFAWSSNTEYKRWNYTCRDTTNIGKLTRCNVELDGTGIICRFQMEHRLVLKHEIFNFQGDHPFHLHLISGCDIADTKHGFLRGGNLQLGENVLAFNKLKNKNAEQFRSIYALWHGCLMYLAWSFLIPNGVFLSRYFKESFVKLSLFKYRFWFAGHVMTMVTAFLITFGSIGVILQDRANSDFAWPTEKSTSIHYNMGLVATLLLVVQVSIGWIRCQGRTLRRSFGALHVLIGTTCYVLSNVSIALSFRLGMPCSIRFYILGSSVVTLIGHFVMTIHFYFLDKQFGLFINRALYPFPLPPVTYTELPGTKTRLIIFMVHFLATLFIAIVALLDYLTYDGTSAKC